MAENVALPEFFIPVTFVPVLFSHLLVPFKHKIDGAIQSLKSLSAVTNTKDSQFYFTILPTKAVKLSQLN